MFRKKQLLSEKRYFYKSQTYKNDSRCPVAFRGRERRFRQKSFQTFKTCFYTLFTRNISEDGKSRPIHRYCLCKIGIDFKIKRKSRTKNLSFSHMFSYRENSLEFCQKQVLMYYSKHKIIY